MLVAGLSVLRTTLIKYKVQLSGFYFIFDALYFTNVIPQNHKPNYKIFDSRDRQGSSMSN